MEDIPIVNDRIWQRHTISLESALDWKCLSEAAKNLIVKETSDYIDRANGQDVPLSFNPPMHSHPMTDIVCNNDLENLATTAIRAAPAFEQNAAKGNYDKLVSLWTSANSLKELHRFASTRQPVLGQRPVPDGSNLEDYYVNPNRPLELINDWKFYRLWIRVLHFSGFQQYPDSVEGPGLDARAMLTNLYRTTRFLLEIELTNFTPDIGDNFTVENSQGMSWMTRSRSIVKKVLEEVATIAYEQQRRLNLSTRMGLSRPAEPYPQMTKDQIFEQNMHPDRANQVFDRMLKRYEELMAHNPFERLIMDLLRLENKFELSLTAEHIEDKLINKQIMPYNEINIANHELASPQTVFEDYEPMGEAIKSEALASVLAKDIALVNRHRHNFRLFRDWSGLRPWWKIFQLYDTSTAETNWLRGAISEFVSHRLCEELDADIIIPSHPQNRAFHSFGFHPLDYSMPSTAEKYQGCGLCAKEYVGSSTHDSSIAVLHCTSKHHFHLGCIFKYWDQEGNYLRECPECGEAPPLNHTNVGIRKYHDDALFNSADPSFALNIFQYNPQDTVWNTMAVTPENSETLYRARKNFYNVPPRPVAGVKRARPQAGDEEHHLYWMRENMYMLCLDAAPLKWVGEHVTPYSFMERGGRNMSDYQRGWNRIVKDMKEQWLRRMNDTRPRDLVDGKTYIHPARYSPPTEAGWLRNVRRRRDRNRRERVKASGHGLSGLGQTFI